MCGAGNGMSAKQNALFTVTSAFLKKSNPQKYADFMARHQAGNSSQGVVGASPSYPMKQGQI